MPGQFEAAVIQRSTGGTAQVEKFSVTGEVYAPKLAIVQTTYPTAVNSPRNGAAIAWGATDGTRQFVVSQSDRDNQSATEVWQQAMTDMLSALQFFQGAINGEGAFSSWVEVASPAEWGVNIDYTGKNFTGNATIAACILGGDIQARVDTHTSHATQNSSIAYTSMGFQLDSLLTVCPRNMAFNDTATEGGAVSLGLLDYDGAAIVQRSLNWREEDNATSSAPCGYVANNRIVQALTTSGVSNGIEVTAVGSSGFTPTTRDAAGAMTFGLVGIKWNGGRHWVGDLLTKTSTGLLVHETSPRFRPKLWISLTSQIQANNNFQNSGQAGSFGMSFMTAANSASGSIQVEHGQSTTDTQTLASDKALDLPQHDFSAGIAATNAGFTNEGVELNYSAALSPARTFPSMAIGARRQCA